MRLTENLVNVESERTNSNKVCGLTFTAYGFDVSSYYRREPDSERKECEWIFKGIGRDEIIGDFGCRRRGRWLRNRSL